LSAATLATNSSTGTDAQFNQRKSLSLLGFVEMVFELEFVPLGDCIGETEMDCELVVEPLDSFETINCFLVLKFEFYILERCCEMSAPWHVN
jgi:hypothetical protein